MALLVSVAVIVGGLLLYIPFAGTLRPVGSVGDALLRGRPPDDPPRGLHQPVVAGLAARSGGVLVEAGAVVLADEHRDARRRHRPARAARRARWRSATRAEWAARVPFCLMGVLGIYAVYLVTARFVSRRAGVLAAVVLRDGADVQPGRAPGDDRHGVRRADGDGAGAGRAGAVRRRATSRCRGGAAAAWLELAAPPALLRRRWRCSLLVTVSRSWSSIRSS